MARAWLTDRTVLSVTGQDRVGFLQGLVSNDVAAASETALIWCGYLTPQGRYLSDFFIWHEPDRLLLDVPADHASMLRTKLLRFRLRADVQIEITTLGVEALWAGDADTEGARVDPRMGAAGIRRIAPLPTGGDEHDVRAYHAHRLQLGLPDTADCESEKTLLIEANFDWLNGISFSKGCYMGQELTARTHYRGLVKKRLVPVEGDGPLPLPGTLLMHEGREIGQMRSSVGARGLALLRREAWSTTLEHEGRTLTPLIPEWFKDELS
ncbi:CAF17-like 4Fe-4S cluster assembly/insertion protein YgfZ [Asaia krungthepensis]|uniref:Glycine cleavage system protein T n=1 Tax=Asaia krungthepensis NRIC 0535 TaxID=1307925 RepID=A0ABQ0PY88_9PROT|nr:folate-binding protein [Asaia krungthepensis]GBQ84585.1 glycine cleavage system protein T [Asaia krungthepensis NRIC 0535]